MRKYISHQTFPLTMYKALTGEKGLPLDLDARVRDLKSSFEYTSLFCKVTLHAHAALLCIKKIELKKIYLMHAICIYSAKKF